LNAAGSGVRGAKSTASAAPAQRSRTAASGQRADENRERVE